MRMKEMVDRYEAEVRVWEGLMGNQTPQEFVDYGRKEGIESIDEMVSKYLEEAPQTSHCGLNVANQSCGFTGTCKTYWSGTSKVS